MTPRVFADRYELLEPLGRGGMGEVWTARDTALGGRRVAVKVLEGDRLASSGGTSDPDDLRRRFLRECRATARIDHPGLVAVHDAGSQNGTLYLVMQLVEGSDLADHGAEWDAEPYPWPWAAAVLAQLSSVLVAVHAADVIHRDLKPGNVMIRPDGRLTVLDLGIAAMRGDTEDTRLTRTGALIGTPVYMAPEQALGSSPVGPAADLYALGVLGYELLTGRAPFLAPDAAGLLYKKLHHRPEPLREVRPDVPTELAEAVDALLAPSPEDRPAHAQELHRGLAPALPGPETADSGRRAMDPTRPFVHPMAPWPPPPRRPRATAPGAVAATGGNAVPGPVAELVDEARGLLDTGRFADAAQVLRRALPMAAAAYGGDSSVVRSLRKQYAATLLETGAYDLALPEVRALLRSLGAERSADDPLLAQLREDERTCLRALSGTLL